MLPLDKRDTHTMRITTYCLMRGSICQVALFFLFGLLLLGCTQQDNGRQNSYPPGSRYAAVEEMINSHTRVVWVQELGQGADPAAQGSNLRLMGFDSRDGRGERAILEGPANFAKPYITPRGNRIVYTDRTKDAVMLVNWDGSGLTKLASGLAMAVWLDPQSGHEWVYVASGHAENRAPTRKRLERLRLDDPSVREFVWDLTPVTEDQIQLSIDGKLAGGTFPWPHAGVAAFPNRGWQRLARGCWSSISPDDQYLFWVFDGSHRNLTLQKYGTSHRWEVPINTAPGIDGYEVYHPRWSNHPRYMVVTGPYTVGVGGNRIRGGGPDVSLHIGRFSEDFRSIEAWVRLTDNALADFYPDVWVASGLEKVLAWSEAQKAEQATEDRAASTLATDAAAASWPATREGLILKWEDASKASVVYDQEAGRFRDFYLEPRGKARFTRHFGMDTAGGFFEAEHVNALLPLLRGAGEMSIEVLVTAAVREQSGPARIITFSSGPSSRNFTLGQSGDRLVLRLRTPQTGPNGVPPELDIARLAAGETVHIVVTYTSERLVAYVDGQQAFSSNAIRGGFENWENQHLLFGDELGGGRPWLGRLEGVALYNRFLEPDEVASNYRAAMERLQGRSAPEILMVKARVVESLPPPTVEAIAPYHRALVINRYEVEEVMEGDAPAGDILVAHWAIMDGKVLENAARIQGEVLTMHLEPFHDRPELEGEKISMEGHDFLLPLYYDTRS